MDSLMLLSLLVNGFGWALIAVGCAVCVAFLYREELSTIVCRTVDYDGLDIEEVCTIEEARIELAQKARERAERAKKSADVSRFEALSARAFFVPLWDGSWQDVALLRLSEKTIGELLTFPGVGPARARRIVDESNSLTLDSVCRILTAPVAERVLLSV